ncbi:ER membrane protein complex subunit 8/9 [Lycorma delicatula]|uniref:ER membrane protein complex subunit 8/9 n=1 Tax=Lycorma delicatula TaxID=130591 RepID=UPI003F51929B
MAEVKFTPRAYCKIILHAAKYPHCAVNGVLLAECGKLKESKKPKNIVYVDAVPLFHLCLHVSPMAEVALTQIEQMASLNGLAIAGYYIANENIRDTSTDKPCNRIADKIAENFSPACLVVVDNQRVTLTMDESPLIISQSVEGKWKRLDKSSLMIEERCLDTAATLLQRQHYEQLIDFDNHLDDISLDWRNKGTNRTIDDLTQVEKE